MAESSKPPAGSILWRDLTVPNADEIKEFYQQVAGWKAEPVSMGDYNDYNMVSSETGETIAGICFKRGTNEKLPSYWLNYIVVDNMDKSIESCLKLGGKVVDGPKLMGQSRFCTIMDPAGAFIALFEQGKPKESA